MTNTFIKGKKVALLAVILLLGITAIQVMAQGKKKKAVTKPATAVPQDQLTEYDSTKYRYFLYPQFYSYWPIDNNDTILKYECYDAERTFINVDTLYNISMVYHIYFVKTYTDYTQTYIDVDGKPRPQPIIKKLYTYDRTGADTWTGFDHINRYTTSLKEYKDDIIRTDTTSIIDPITGTRQITIRKYYKVMEIERSDSGTASAPIEGPEAAQKKISAVVNYLVPEFYFYVPRKSRDTLFEFKCYDYKDSLVPVVENYDSIRYYSLFKSYTDSFHTYKDKDGVKRLLPVSSIAKRYDKVGSGKWMSIEYPSNKYQDLTEYRDNIVTTDTISVVDPVSDKTTLKVFKFYRVIK